MWLYQMGHPTGDNTLVHVDCGTKALASVREAHRMTGNPSPPEVLRPQKRLQTVSLSKTPNLFAALEEGTAPGSTSTSPEVFGQIQRALGTRTLHSIPTNESSHLGKLS